MAYVYAAHAGRVTIFSTGGKSNQFHIWQSYILLLFSPVLVRSCWTIPNI